MSAGENRERCSVGNKFSVFPFVFFCLNGKFYFPFDDDQTSGDCAQLVAPWSFSEFRW